MSNRFIQAHNGNFELLAFDNNEGGRLLNLTSDNSAPSPKCRFLLRGFHSCSIWTHCHRASNLVKGANSYSVGTSEEVKLSGSKSRIISKTVGSAGAIVQSTHSVSGFEILVPELFRIQRYFLDKSDEKNIKVEDRGIVSETCTGFQSFIRSRPNLETNPDAHGNFEAVVLEAEGLVHYRLVNASPDGTWIRGKVISEKATAPGCIIQSTLGMTHGNPGNLEVVVLEGPELVHYYLDNSRHFEQPEWRRASSITRFAQAPGCIIQSKLVRTDVPGDFEVVVPEAGMVVHYGMDNSQANNGYWAMRGIVAMDACGPATLIQSSIPTLSGVGRFEVMVEHENKDGKHWLVHYWKDPMSFGSMWESTGVINGAH